MIFVFTVAVESNSRSEVAWFARMEYLHRVNDSPVFQTKYLASPLELFVQQAKIKPFAVEAA